LLVARLKIFLRASSARDAPRRLRQSSLIDDAWGAGPKLRSSPEPQYRPKVKNSNRIYLFGSENFEVKKFHNFRLEE
jgi:hypothetical protein